MFTHTSRSFRLAFVAVGALIATSAVSLTVVLTHDDTAMAAGKPWPSKPAATSRAAAPASSLPAATPAPTSAQTSPVAENSPVAETPSGSTKKTQAARAPLTYTVKKGDNLTVIADWFKLRGYGDLYERNRKTIGTDPDLIKPGQKITVSSAGMSTSG